MNELIQSFTALPNLHPALVHFPIALLPVAFTFDLLGLLSKQRWLLRAGALLWALGALGAGAAYWAGKQAADSLVGVPPRVQVHIATHSDWALYTLWAIGVVALLRLGLAYRDRSSNRLASQGAHWGLLVVGVGALGLVMRTADLGGGLVYQHAVAVQEETADEHFHEEPVVGAGQDRLSDTDDDTTVTEPPSARWVEGEDGIFIWSPLPTDGEALGSVLVAAPGSSLEAVTAAEPLSGSEGLRLAVNGQAVLVLPGTFGDVQLDAVLDFSAFDGTVGLVHHTQSAETAGLFSVSTSGTASLIVLDGGTTKTLHEQEVELPSQPIELAVSSSGRHLKGLIDGKTVTHGHVAPGEAGGCGLLLEGSGTVGILSFRLTPLT